MRSPLVLLGFVATTLCAQDQDRTLIDRLLRPNLHLQNREQGKVFRADSKVVASPVTAKAFGSGPVMKQNAFSDVRVAETKEYRSPSNPANVSHRGFVQIPEVRARAQLASPSARELRSAYDANLEVSSRRFVDERVFRGEGKSQKSLNRQNPSLTIEQVRELLNKNK